MVYFGGVCGGGLSMVYKENRGMGHISGPSWPSYLSRRCHGSIGKKARPKSQGFIDLVIFFICEGEMKTQFNIRMEYCSVYLKRL